MEDMVSVLGHCRVALLVALFCQAEVFKRSKAMKSSRLLRPLILVSS